MNSSLKIVATFLALNTGVSALDGNAEAPPEVYEAAGNRLQFGKESVSRGMNEPNSRFYGLIVDTADIVTGKAFPFYVSDGSTRVGYTPGQPVDSILYLPDSTYGFVVPFMYRGISFGWVQVFFENGRWDDGEAVFGARGDLSDLRNTWPEEEGYYPVLIRVGPCHASVLYFHIPELDNTNLTSLRGIPMEQNEEDRARRAAIKASLSGAAPAGVQSLSATQRYRDVSNVFDVITTIEGRGK